MKQFVLYFCFLVISSHAYIVSISSTTIENNESGTTTSLPKPKPILNLTATQGRASWNDANLECRKHGGSLLNIRSPYTLHYLQDWLVRNNLTDTWYWIKSDLLTKRLLRINVDDPDWENNLYVEYNLESCFMIKLSEYNNNRFHFLNTDCDEYVSYLCQCGARSEEMDYL